MKEMNMNAATALIRLSGLAADFKMGIVPDREVEEIICAIVDGLDLNDRDKLVLKVDALSAWGIHGDEV
jgi:hypothetical protein